MIIRRLFKALGIVLGTAFLLICLLNVFHYRLSMSAGPFEVRWDGLLWNPPLCVVNGETLGAVFPPTEYFWTHGVALGSVLIHEKTEKPVLAFDATHFKRMPPEVQRFIIHHECGHVKLGHLKWIIYDDPNSLEKQSDCYAMKAIKEEGWPQSRIDNLFSAIVDDELMEPAHRGVVFIEERAMAHRWTPQKRVEHAKSCLTP